MASKKKTTKVESKGPTTKIARFERRVTNGVRNFLKSGGKLMYGSFCDKTMGDCRCAISATYGLIAPCDRAMRLSKLTDEQLWSFIHGFDDESFVGGPGAAEYFKLGKKIRNKFKKHVVNA